MERKEPAAPAGETAAPAILDATCRYIERYHWSWNMACRLVNRYFGTGYTEAALRRLYRQARDTHQA